MMRSALATGSPLLLAALLAAGCAGYAGSVADIRSALAAGDKPRALQQANGALKVKKSDEFPRKLKGNNALLLLERAMIKQGLSEFEASAEDFQVSEKHLELLDLQNDTIGNIGQWLFSDDATIYKAPAYEKLLLNTFNMLNYLARGDAERALTFYGDALVNASYPSLLEPVRRLAACSSHRTPEIDKLLGQAGPSGPCAPNPKDRGTILVISSVGLAPHKVAARIPIGIALAIAGVFISSENAAAARSLIGRGLLTWINFPVLEKTPEQYSTVQVKADGTGADTEPGLDVTDRVVKAWDSIKGKLMGAAIVRMVTRLLAGIAAEQAAKSAGGGAIGSLFAGLAVQGALTVADTPDTRSWVTLPSRVFLTRIEVPPGTHEVEIAFEGRGGREVVRRSVRVAGGGFAVLPVASMR